MLGNSIFKNVLLLTDFSDSSRNAIKYAVKALGSKSSYTLLNCYFCRTSASTFIDINEMVHEESEYLLKKEQKWIADEFPDLDLNVELYSKYGRPVDVVKEYLNDGIDLIVLGSKGRSKMENFFVGSSVSSIIPKVNVPVLCVPLEASYGAIDKVALANDLTSISKESNLTVVRSLKNLFKCDIVSLSVRPHGWEPNKEEFEVLDRLSERKFIKNVSIVEDADTSTALITYCFQNKMDLLVVISKSRGFFQRLFKRSISQEVLGQAEMPVLIL